jgi:hypothetical protein
LLAGFLFGVYHLFFSININSPFSILLYAGIGALTGFGVGSILPRVFALHVTSFNRAAPCSLFIPIITCPLVLLLAFIRRTIATDAIFDCFLCAFCLQVIGLILGIVSFFGVRKYGDEVIVWKGIVGIVASCSMGIMIFALGAGIAMERSH